MGKKIIIILCLNILFIWTYTYALHFQRAINWASAYDPLDAPLQTEKDDVPAVSAGKLPITFLWIFPCMLIYSVSMKSYQYRNFGKYIIQLFGYCYVHVSGHRQAGLER